MNKTSLATVPPRHSLVIAIGCFILSALIISAVSCEAQERQQPDQTLRAMQWGIVGSQLADALTTIRAIQSGAGREGNPAMVWAASNPALLTTVKLGTAIGLNYGLSRLAKRHRTAALVLGFAVVGSVSTVAIRNSRIH